MASFLDGRGGYCTCTRDKCTDECATYRRFKPKQTNADRIRAMTDEELAFYIVNHPKWTDETACINWLREEVSTDG